MTSGDCVLCLVEAKQERNYEKEEKICETGSESSS